MTDRRRDPNREVARRAQRFANPSCKRCYGRGVMGRRYLPDGTTQLLICKCAAGGFPELQGHIGLPDGKRDLSPRS